MNTSRSVLFLFLLSNLNTALAYKFRQNAPLVRNNLYTGSSNSIIRESSDCSALDELMMPAQEFSENAGSRESEKDDMMKVEMVGRKSTITLNLLRGSFLRVASDLTGGTPLEVIKSRVTITGEAWSSSVRQIFTDGGISAFWRGTPSRTVEGFFMGAIFLAGSAATKKQVLRVRPNSKTCAALAGGLVGGVAQAFVMTPAGLIFTTVNDSDEDVSSLKVLLDIMKERGPLGLFAGFDAMALRQATNWASRTTFTEIARTNLKMSRYGLIGEIGSGIIGGLGSTWNTPIETLRVLKQRDIAKGEERPYSEYKEELMEEGGYQSLYRGITPRGIQAIWQTCFMVVVPNILGI